MNDSNNASPTTAKLKIKRSFGKFAELVRQIKYRSTSSHTQPLSIPASELDRVEGQVPDEAEGQAPDEAAVPPVEGHSQAQPISNDIAPQSMGTPAGSPIGDTPPRTPPLSQGLIDRGESRKAMGQGMFAKIAMEEGEVIFNEASTLCCDYRRTWRHTHCTAVEQWAKLDNGKRGDLRLNFPQVHDLPDERLSSRQKRKLVKFVREYAFRPDNTLNNQNRALIYAKPCLLNHACVEHANCSFSVSHDEPHTIRVHLKRNVTEHKELLITYRGGGVGLSCADCCSPLHNKFRRSVHKIRRGIADVPFELKMNRRSSQAKTQVQNRAKQQNKPEQQTEIVQQTDNVQPRVHSDAASAADS